MTQPVDQLQTLRELRAEDQELCQTLILSFNTQTPEFLGEIESLMQQQNHEKLKSTAHAFKGVALNLGFSQLGNLLKDIENAAQAQDQQKAEEKFSAIKTEIATLTAQFDQF